MDKACTGSDGKIFGRVPSRGGRYVNGFQLGSFSGKPSEITFVGCCQAERRIRTDSKTKVGIWKLVIGK
jgi:hypothetical protein